LPAGCLGPIIKRQLNVFRLYEEEVEVEGSLVPSMRETGPEGHYTVSQSLVKQFLIYSRK